MFFLVIFLSSFPYFVINRAISGDAPDWITSNVSKYDKDAVIQRVKKTKGVRSIIIDDNGTEICDSTVSGDAPSFMVETNRRIDPKMIVHPPRYKQPWHNRDSPRKMHGMHASTQSTETYDEPRGGVKTDYQQDYGHASSNDTPYFIAASEKRNAKLGDVHPTSHTMKRRPSRTKAEALRKSNIMKAAGAASANKRASWDNRNVMGGCHGRVTFKEKSDYASEIASLSAGETLSKHHLLQLNNTYLYL